MVAYLTKTRLGFELRLCAGPCNGPAYANAEKFIVTTKKEARLICLRFNATPYNF